MHIGKTAASLACVFALSFALVSSSQAHSGSAGYNKDEGGFVLMSSDEDFKLLITGRFQPRFDIVDWDDEREIEDTETFSIRRTRILFQGHLFGKKNRYSVHLAADAPRVYWDRETAVYGEIKVFDAWIEHVFTPSAALKFGQFKMPFSRQHLTPGSKLQFPDRAHATETLRFDFRDIGAQVSGGFRDGLVQYRVAIANGSGRNELNRDGDATFFGRVDVNPTGDYGFSEGDTGRKDRNKVATTVGFAIHNSTDEIGESPAGFWRLNADGGVKYKGFSAQAEGYWTRVDPDVAEVFKQTFFYIQGGYFVKPEKFEIAVRGSWVLPERDDSDERELSLGVSYLIRGHRLKWQAAYSYFSYEVAAADDLEDHRFVLQAQVWF